MNASQHAIPACKIVADDRCAVCRKFVNGESFYHTCGWLFCSKSCSDIGSKDAIEHENRIVEAIRAAVMEEREACAVVAADFVPDASISSQADMIEGIADAIRARAKP